MKESSSFPSKDLRRTGQILWDRPKPLRLFPSAQRIHMSLAEGNAWILFTKPELAQAQECMHGVTAKCFDSSWFLPMFLQVDSTYSTEFGWCFYYLSLANAVVGHYICFFIMFWSMFLFWHLWSHVTLALISACTKINVLISLLNSTCIMVHGCSHFSISSPSWQTFWKPWVCWWLARTSLAFSPLWSCYVHSRIASLKVDRHVRPSKRRHWTLFFFLFYSLHATARYKESGRQQTSTGRKFIIDLYLFSDDGYCTLALLFVSLHVTYVMLLIRENSIGQINKIEFVLINTKECKNG